MGIRLDDNFGYCELGKLYGYGSNFSKLPDEVQDAIDDEMRDADFMKQPWLNPDNMWCNLQKWTFEDAKKHILGYDVVLESEIDDKYIKNYIEDRWWFIGEFDDIYYFFFT